MTTAVRWAEQVTKAFYLPSSESILRIVTRWRHRRKRWTLKKITLAPVMLVTLMERSEQINFRTARISQMKWLMTVSPPEGCCIAKKQYHQ
jgi:hypothetical protein